jgi:hypothetical protein
MQRLRNVILKGSLLLLFGFIAMHLGSCSSGSRLESTAVTPAVPDELVVSPQNPTISDAMTTQTFKAIGYYGDGSTIDLTSFAAWSSSNAQVATVSSTGIATSVVLPNGQSAGFASIQAVFGTVKGVSILSVTNHQGNGFAGVFTQHNDLARTGQNVNETLLTPANVNSTSFGKIFSQPVDGNVYAQPLYVPNVTIPGLGTHNVVYVATEADSVYAFDADGNIGSNASPLWRASLLDTAHGAPPGALVGDDRTSCDAIVPHVGVTSTPVIDPSSGTLYAVAKSEESNNAVTVYRLHALDITTGAEKTPGPVVITGTVSGTGDGSSGGSLAFAAGQHLNRAGLLLVNGMVYVVFASNCDFKPFHGWLFAYETSNFSQPTIFVSTPNGSDGGIWMSGAGIAADSNANLYVATGNGTFDTTNIPATEFGNTLLKLNLRGSTISVLDYFTPSNQAVLNPQDLDVGSGGILLLPDQPGAHPHEMVQAGKWQSIYLLDRDQMTSNNLHYCVVNCNGADPQIVQELQFAISGTFGIPAYWNNSVYLGSNGSPLHAYALSNGMLSAVPTAVTHNVYPFPSPTPSVSANGSSSGIVWAIDASQFGNEGHPLGPSVLHAYDATNVANELFNSSQALNSRDVAGNSVKFSVPTVAKGKVYIGTQTEMDVYGVLPPANAQILARPRR